MNKPSVFRIMGIALVGWLGLFASSANAVTSLSPWSGSPSAGYNRTFGNNGVTSPFSDSFLFSLPGASSGNGESNAISLSASDVIFTTFDLYESSLLIASGTTGTTESSLSFTGGAVPGSYELKVGGYKVNAALSGSYAGNIGVSPIPEPETYGMLLLGLGLLGLSIRRRKIGSIN